jgi:Glycogen recognition site of AMP-activated protein kinase
MKKFFLVAGLLVAAVLDTQVTTATMQQAQTAPATDANARAKPDARRKIDPAVLKKYAGRYELGAGVIPISTLDVTFENNELWVKPSLVKKRKLIARSKKVFLDEIEGTRYTFNLDEEGRALSLTFQFEGSAYTAQKVSLPPPSLKGNTTFKLKGYAEAQVVALAGSFNNWNESQLLFAREGDEWVCRVELAPDRYTYKFIVDGNWLLDPSNPETEEDQYGNLNSVLVIKQK